MKVPFVRQPEIEKQLLAQTQEASHVYIHCHYQNGASDMLMRIWLSTFIIDLTTNERTPLVHAENISYAPSWTMVPANTRHSFLLIFPALPKSCTRFDLLEDINQPARFHIPGITRNNRDIYHIEIL